MNRNRDEIQPKLGKLLRKARGDTPAVAIAARAGIGPVYLCQLEGGDGIPSLPMLYKLAKALHVKVQDILP